MNFLETLQWSNGRLWPKATEAEIEANRKLLGSSKIRERIMKQVPDFDAAYDELRDNELSFNGRLPDEISAHISE